MNVTLAATESFNERNGNATLAEAIASGRGDSGHGGAKTGDSHHFCRVRMPVRREGGSRCRRGHCRPFSGRAEVVLADTIGVAAPSAVRNLIERTKSDGFHGHNTRNTGYANALAAVEAGATVLDASIGGLGGCPYAPRATGNVATEDLVYLLEAEGVATGIDVDELIEHREVARVDPRPPARGLSLSGRSLAVTKS